MSNTVARPMMLISGGLGSGKSSGLTHLLDREQFSAPYILINDVGQATVEINESGLQANIETLSGGCACCTKKQELLEILDKAVEQTHAACDVIFVEASGAADVTEIARTTIEHPKLKHHLKIEQIVHYIDASAPALLADTLQQNALVLADVCVISKWDLLDEEQTAVLARDILEINPMLTLVKQYFDGENIRIKEILSPERRNTVRNFAKVQETSSGHAKPTVANYTLPEGISWMALSTWMIALLDTWGEHIIRVKATIPTSDNHSININGVRNMVYPPALLDAINDSSQAGTLVMIGSNFNPSEVLRSLQAFVSKDICLK